MARGNGVTVSLVAALASVLLLPLALATGYGSNNLVAAPGSTGKGFVFFEYRATANPFQAAGLEWSIIYWDLTEPTTVMGLYYNKAASPVLVLDLGSHHAMSSLNKADPMDLSGQKLDMVMGLATDDNIVANPYYTTLADVNAGMLAGDLDFLVQSNTAVFPSGELTSAGVLEKNLPPLPSYESSVTLLPPVSRARKLVEGISTSGSGQFQLNWDGDAQQYTWTYNWQGLDQPPTALTWYVDLPGLPDNGGRIFLASLNLENGIVTAFDGRTLHSQNFQSTLAGPNRKLLDDGSGFVRATLNSFGMTTDYCVPPVICNEVNTVSDGVNDGSGGPSSSCVGDPILTSFDGRAFQFHGHADQDSWFNMLTESKHQVSTLIAKDANPDHYGGSWNVKAAFAIGETRIMVAPNGFQKLSIEVDGSRAALTTGENNMLRLQDGAVTLLYVDNTGRTKHDGETLIITTPNFQFTVWAPPKEHNPFADVAEAGEEAKFDQWTASLDFSVSAIAKPAGEVHGLVGQTLRWVDPEGRASAPADMTAFEHDMFVRINEFWMRDGPFSTNWWHNRFTTQRAAPAAPGVCGVMSVVST
ncbi:hypothetical protein WJX72_003073 [[Myrmecia] bisecta]|uniref:Uncharacterized protein n=1 Tax=[Myrmecia] bisecta TaxID=41462 RepID=A0AAW1P719_9CHLO